MDGARKSEVVDMIKCLAIDRTHQISFGSAALFGLANYLSPENSLLDSGCIDEGLLWAGLLAWGAGSTYVLNKDYIQNGPFDTPYENQKELVIASTKNAVVHLTHASIIAYPLGLANGYLMDIVF